MPARIIVIGLDAAEATLIERWASEGTLPTFARLASEGATVRLENSLETLPGAIWPELTTGRSGGKLGRFFHAAKLHTGEVDLRRIEPEEADPADFYWNVASEAGRRVAIIDQPQTVLSPRLNGVQLLEWGLHDRSFQIDSHPPELLAELRARHGDHPVQSCDAAHGGTYEGYERLLEDLRSGAERKTALLLDVLGQERWDLFACGFGETHCAGHQFWHFLDPRQPGHDPAAPPALRGAVESVYRAVDRGVGAVIEAAGPDAVVLVVASHGMGPYIGGYQLLPELLVRLGLGSGRGAAAQVRSHLPAWVRAILRRVVPASVRRPLQAAAGSLPKPLESPLTRAVTLPNNRCGAIRLNLRGREPFGCVEPGEEAATLIEELRRELLALEDPASGKQIVKHVVTAAEAFGPDHHPDTPDVMVAFRTDLGPIEACRSERVGYLRVAVANPKLPRTGDHTVESRLWALGPGIPSGRRPDGNALDLAPTVLRLLGVPLPDRLDGRPLSLAEVGARP